MGSAISRSVVAQAVVVIMTVTLFAGVLTIAGSVPNYDLPEHTLRNASATATPGPDDDLPTTVRLTHELVDNPSVTVSPSPDPDDGLISLPARNVQSLPVTLSGHGSQKSGSFLLTPGIISFDLWIDAPGNLEVWQMYDGERFDRLLENGVIVEGPVVEEIIISGTYFL